MKKIVLVMVLLILTSSASAFQRTTYPDKLAEKFVSPDLGVGKQALELIFNANSRDFSGNDTTSDQVLQKLNNKKAFILFRQIHGPWRMIVDKRSGSCVFMDGKGIPWIPGDGVGNDIQLKDLSDHFSGPRTRVTRDILEAKAREFLDEWSELFGIDPDDFILNPTATKQASKDLWYVNFDYAPFGIKVENSFFVFRISHGNLIQVGHEGIAPLTIEPTITVSLERAWQILKAYLADGPDLIQQRKANRIITLQNPAWHENMVGSGYSHKVVWDFHFRAKGYQTLFRAWVDAASSELIMFRDETRYGHIDGGIYPVHNEQPEEVRPFPHADYGTSIYTDLAGYYPGSGGISTLTGEYLNINDNCGDISLTADGTGDIHFGISPGIDCITPGYGGEGNTHASRSCFYHINQIFEKARKYDPDNNDNWLRNQLTANVNINQTCNAFWNGSTINFYRSGDGCNNTGELMSVFLHEWGHGYDENDGNAAAPEKGSGETYGDWIATLQSHDSCVGRTFHMGRLCGYGNSCIDCTGVRELDYERYWYPEPMTLSNADTTYRCPTDPSYCGPCGFEGHCESVLASQALWDLALRELPTQGYSQPTAWLLSDRLWYESRGTEGSCYQCDNNPETNGCNAGSLYNIYRAVDDVDGDLSNGTPHAGSIFAALNRHEIACGLAFDPNNQNSQECPTLAPPMLSGLAGINQNTLEWTFVNGASEYILYRNELDCDAGFTEIFRGQALNFIDIQAVDYTMYFYRVVATSNSGDCVGNMSNCIVLIPGCSQPAAPVWLSATTISDIQIDLSWQVVPGATGYNLYRSDGNCPGGDFEQIASHLSGSFFSDLYVYYGQTYSYIVRAYYLNVGCESSDSLCAQETTTCSTTLFDGLQSVTNLAQTECALEFEWAPANPVCGSSVSYAVYRDQNPGFLPDPGNMIASCISSTSYIDETGVADSMDYYYIVRAEDDNNFGSGPCNSGYEDTNMIELTGQPTGIQSVIYFEDFESGAGGWVHSAADSTASTGDWFVGDPDEVVNDGVLAQPEDDHTPDPGINCFFTQPNTGGIGEDDVDNGYVTGYSPIIDLSAYTTSTRLELSLWYFYGHRTPGDDPTGDWFRIDLSNDGGLTFPVNLVLLGDVKNHAYWTYFHIDLDSQITVTDTMMIRIQVSDGPDVGDLVEGGIDDVKITDALACNTPNGVINLDRNYYNCSDIITMTVTDTHLIGLEKRDVIIESNSETVAETVTLVEIPSNSGKFTGSIPTTGALPLIDGFLSISHGDNIAATYIDADDGSGGVDIPKIDIATADCAVPVITHVQVIDITTTGATICWDTDELSDSTVYYWSKSSLVELSINDASLTREHSITLDDLTECTKYYFSISSTDMASNTATDDNSGVFFIFSTYEFWAVFSDDMETGPGNWIADPPWEIVTESSQNPSKTWSDSPGGTYGNNINISLTLLPFDIPETSEVILSFRQTYDFEVGWDYGYVEISTNGIIWDRLDVLNGLQTDWNEAIYDITSYSGTPDFQVRFRLDTDSATVNDGWHIDDVKISCAKPCGLDVDVLPDGITTECSGMDIPFTATVTDQVGWVTYQWTEDGVDIPGAVYSSYIAHYGGQQIHLFNCNVSDARLTEISDLSSSTGEWIDCDSPPPPAADGVTGIGIQLTKGPGTSIDVQYDKMTCRSDHAVMLYGVIGDFSSYSGAVIGCNLGSDGQATIDVSAENVWFNVIWVNTSETAGHPGFASYGDRILFTNGYCGITADDHSDNLCN